MDGWITILGGGLNSPSAFQFYLRFITAFLKKREIEIDHASAGAIRSEKILNIRTRHGKTSVTR